MKVLKNYIVKYYVHFLLSPKDKPNPPVIKKDPFTENKPPTKINSPNLYFSPILKSRTVTYDQTCMSVEQALRKS